MKHSKAIGGSRANASRGFLDLAAKTEKIGENSKVEKSTARIGSTASYYLRMRHKFAHIILRLLSTFCEKIGP
jgi:hypothetical protein